MTRIELSCADSRTTIQNMTGPMYSFSSAASVEAPSTQMNFIPPKTDLTGQQSYKNSCTSLLILLHFTPIATSKINMQMKLLPQTWKKDKFSFGGALLKGSHPKQKRIFRPQLPLHVVIRSSKAVGKHSLLLKNKAISTQLKRQSEKHFVRIYNVANAGNHLHLLIQAPSRNHLSNFLRAITGRIAQLALAGCKDRPVKERAEKSLRFWDARPFSRIVSWGKDFQNVARYIGINSTEMIGVSRYNVRQMFLAIQIALDDGGLAKSPTLVAAGFV